MFRKILYEKIYERSNIGNRKCIKLPYFQNINKKNKNKIKEKKYFCLDKTIGNWSILYINSRNFYCLLLTSNEILIFNKKIINGLTELKETIIWGIFIIDEIPIFFIYDAIIINEKNVCCLNFQERRSLIKNLIEFFIKNKEKGRILSKLILSLKIPYVSFEKIILFNDYWKYNKPIEILFQWKSLIMKSNGILFFEKYGFFFSQRKCFIPFFQFSSHSIFHILIRIKKSKFHIFVNSKCKKIFQTIWLAERLLELMQNISRKKNLNEINIFCVFDTKINFWLPIDITNEKKVTLKYIKLIEIFFPYELSWNELLNIKKSHSKSKYLLVFQEINCSVCLNFINNTQNKKKKMELIAVPKIHDKEFIFEKHKKSFLFWWKLMKFSINRIFNRLKKLVKNGLTKIVLKISYRKWNQHLHTHVYIDLENFFKIIKQKIRTQIIFQSSTYILLKLGCLKNVSFRNWCFNRNYFNTRPIFMIIHQQFRLLSGFQLQIKLKNINKKIKNKYYILTTIRKYNIAEKCLAKKKEII